MTDHPPGFDPRAIPNLSLVIPTLKRKELLGKLLSSLAAQQVEKGTFEVIVVDNSLDGDDATRELCQQVQLSTVLDVHYVHHPEPGPNEARNCGARHAQADWIGFIDDDETLPQDWVGRAIHISQILQPDGFGGPYIPSFDSAKPSWFKDEYLLIGLGQDAHWLEKGEALNGGNMVIKRGQLDKIGGFPKRFGRIGHNLEYGEDTDLIYRMVKKGARLWYDPQLFINHFTPAKRMTVGWFMRSRWLHGKGKAFIRFEDPTNRDNRSGARVALSGIKNLLIKSVELTKLYLRIPFRDRKKCPAVQNYLVEIICPQISGFSSAWHFLILNLAREDSNRPAQA